MDVKFFNQMKIALRLLIFIIFITGILYPALVTGIAEWMCPWKANGSLLNFENKRIGSLLIGQSFTSNKYFWGRLSATQPFPYNAENSSGSNLGPLSPLLLSHATERVAALHRIDITNTQPIPVDLVTASGSGLDPDITLEAALYQVPRIAKIRHLSEKNIISLVRYLASYPRFGFLGEEKVNVLQLNLALNNLPVQTNE